jgi:hypothetical protein
VRCVVRGGGGRGGAWAGTGTRGRHPRTHEHAARASEHGPPRRTPRRHSRLRVAAQRRPAADGDAARLRLVCVSVVGGVCVGGCGRAGGGSGAKERCDVQPARHGCAHSWHAGDAAWRGSAVARPLSPSLCVTYPPPPPTPPPPHTPHLLSCLHSALHQHVRAPPLLRCPAAAAAAAAAGARPHAPSRCCCAAAGDCLLLQTAATRLPPAATNQHAGDHSNTRRCRHTMRRVWPRLPSCC